MTTRRAFLGLLGAGAMMPGLTWADMGAPAYLAAARRPSGDFALFGLDAAGRDLFSVALPARAHSNAVHPTLAQATVFARRPGTFALVLDCATGRVLTTLTTPDTHYFCGHGTFNAAGTRLYTTETEIASGEGRVGIWDATASFRRITAIPSGGIGPHECTLLPGDLLAVANGSLETGPDGKADPISIEEMRPNLAYIDLATGRITQVLEPPADLRRNSIRHIAVRPDGLVAFAMQWHGSGDEAPLLGLHRPGEPAARLFTAPDQAALQSYAGSVAFSGDGRSVAISSPHGGVIDIFSVASGAHAGRLLRPDVCGLARHGAGFAATSGAGDWLTLDATSTRPDRVVTAEIGRAWDNHMTALGT